VTLLLSICSNKQTAVSRLNIYRPWKGIRPQRGKRAKIPVSNHLMEKKETVPGEPVLPQLNGQKLESWIQPKVYLAVKLFILT
jgi:hypothetical protein